MADLVLDDGQSIRKTTIDGLQRSSNPRDNTIAGLMTDRNGNPPTQEQMQEMQNKIMGRAPNFSKLPESEKERIMFDELQNWFFKDMPSIDQMKKELQEHPLSYEVSSLNDSDTKGVNNTHINIKNENVNLTIVSDGKTLKFNNKELLEEYRNNINKQEIEKNSISEVQTRGIANHSNRKFE